MKIIIKKKGAKEKEGILDLSVVVVFSHIKHCRIFNLQ